MWEALFAFHICIACSLPELLRRPVVERAVRTLAVVQVGYKTPIKPAFEKCSTAGTHGMGSRCAFKSKRDAVAVRFCVACETN